MVDRLIEDVRSRMRRRRTTQIELAKSCGCTQAHLSKVLRGRAKLSGNLSEALREWLGDTAERQHADIEAMLRRIEAIDAKRRKHILHIIRELLALT